MRLLLCIALAGCAGARTDAAEPAEPVARPDERPPPEDSRALPIGARFADLLQAARALDDRRDQESSAGCLLRRSGDRWRLEADLAVAVRPLPAPPDDLDELLEPARGPINLLSRWGAYGDGQPERPSFVAVTTTLPPRREPAIVWAISDRGVYVRSSRDPGPAGALTLDQARASLGDAGALFVTAEAGTSVARVAEALGAVPDSLAGRVGFAVALAPGTRLPSPPPEEPASAHAALCPAGLPELNEDAAIGDLSAEAIVRSLDPLRRGAEICVGTTHGPGAAGGRVVLALRIARDGRVSDACVVSDSADDPVLRECLVGAARATSFPAPDPPGSVDAELPLVLAPLASQRQQPLCR